MLIKLTSRDNASNHYVNLFAIGMLVPNDGGAWSRITLSTARPAQFRFTRRICVSANPGRPARKAR